MKYLTYWWIFLCVQLSGLALAASLGVFNLVFAADVSRMTFVILLWHICGSLYIGRMTYSKMKGCTVNESSGWFLSEAAFMLGMIGTVTGMIYTLISTLGGGVDPTQLKQVVTELARGVGTSGWTTLFGITSSLFLKAQMNNLESM